MSFNKRTNWILSSLGLLSVAFSLIIIFATPTVYASCSASVPCGGQQMSCSCPGGGTCESDGQCIKCTCQGGTNTPRTCCIDQND